MNISTRSPLLSLDSYTLMYADDLVLMSLCKIEADHCINKVISGYTETHIRERPSYNVSKKVAGRNGPIINVVG